MALSVQLGGFEITNLLIHHLQIVLWLALVFSSKSRTSKVDKRVSSNRTTVAIISLIRSLKDDEIWFADDVTACTPGHLSRGINQQVTS